MMAWLFSWLLLTGYCEYQNPVQEIASADEVLQATSEKLQALRHLRYTALRVLDYPSESYHHESRWNVYIDFNSQDTVAGFRYRVEDSVKIQYFNGTERFDLQKADKTIEVEALPQERSFELLSFLYNSLITTRNILPLIIKDQTITKWITDTVISGKGCYAVTVNPGKRRIQNLGKAFDNMQTKTDFIYQFIIEKESHLPIAILQRNNLNNDGIRTFFNDINTNKVDSDENSWYYSAYLNDYKPAAKKVKVPLIAVNAVAPIWELPLHDKNETVSLTALRGKVVLLDFWIRNCGPCIRSVPHLNKLQSRYINKGFQVISINAYDPADEIKAFVQRHKSIYTVLRNGKAVASAYGVEAYPALVLIDKQGKVSFVWEGFDEQSLASIEKQIDVALQAK